MKPTVIIVSIVLCTTFFASVGIANPVALWYLRDSPVETPNGVWDDQWSGGTVFPEGELIIFDPPPYGHECAEYEWAASFARVGSGENALYAYTDPPFTGTQPDGTITAILPFRQTCWEMATVTVTAYQVDADGGSPVELASDLQQVVAAGWPPTSYFFVLGDVPEIEMVNQRFLIVISTEDGECTDLVWDCCVQFPEEGPNPVTDVNWGTIKALYR